MLTMGWKEAIFLGSESALARTKLAGKTSRLPAAFLAKTDRMPARLIKVVLVRK